MILDLQKKVVFPILYGEDSLTKMDCVRLIKREKYLFNYLYNQKILQLSKSYIEFIHFNVEKCTNEFWTEKLDLYIQKTKKRSALLYSNLYEVSKILINKSIDFISIKGPLFSEIYYGGIDKRIYGDIDILISKNDVEYTKKVLIEEGYSVDLELYNKCLDFHYHFVAKKDGVSFEIHWNIDYGDNDYWSYLSQETFLWNVKDIMIKVLNNEAQFILFLVSISKDWFSNVTISKYFDLLKILDKEPLDTSRVRKIINYFGLANRCYVVLYCLNYFLTKKKSIQIKPSFLTKIYTMIFLRKKIILKGIPVNKKLRKLGEKIIWDDASFTTVPNIFIDNDV